MLFHSKEIKAKETLYLISFSCFICLFLALYPISQFLSDNFGLPISFEIRKKLGQEPLLDPRLKILGFGDKSHEKLGEQETVPLEDWAVLLKSLDKTNPRAIVVDKFFSVKPTSKDSVSKFLAILSDIKTPIISAVSLSDADRPKHENFPDSKLRIYGDTTDTSAEISNTAWLSGPLKDLQHFFTDYGLINVGQHGSVPPYVLFENNRYVLSLGLTTAAQVEVNKNSLVIDGKSVTLDRNNHLLSNFFSREKYYKNAKEILQVFEWAKSGIPIPDIQQGDIVLILPSMYTGNTDMKHTPVGTLEGGFIHAANLNSVLTGKWTRYIGASFFLTFFIAFLSTIPIISIAYSNSAKKNFILRSSMLIMVIVTGLSAFVWFGLVFPWIQAALAVLAVSIYATVKGAIQLDRYSVQITQALEGLVSPQLLGRLKKNPNLMKIKESEVYVTVMFIDVESFSLRSQKLTPSVVFRDLRQGLSSICKLVHGNGGVVDKTLGDGILCFFGFSLDNTINSNAIKNHATAAIKTAIEIQRFFAEDINAQSRSKAEGLLLPLRIGLNSGPVFFGNLGMGLRVDLTIVGDAVNYAKRLEDVCEPFRIMLGPETMKLIKEEASNSQQILPTNIKFNSKLFNIKHVEELMSGFECEPLADELQDHYDTALFNIRIQEIRKSKRYPVPRESNLKIRLSEGSKARLLNYSIDGLAIETDVYLARKVRLSLWFEDVPDSMLKRLSANMFLPISVEVRWSSKKDNRIFLGLSLLNTSNDRKNFLINLIMEQFGHVGDTFAG